MAACLNHAMTVTLTFVLLACMTFVTCDPTPRLTCPMRGCSPHGAHALATPLPEHPRVNWTWTREKTAVTGAVSRGCSSGLFFVNCAIGDGYVTLDTTGQLTWNTSDMTSPYLPIVDFFGNAYGSDATKFNVIYYTGDDSNPLNMSLYRPQFGAAISNSADKNVVMTSSDPSTPQLLSRLLDGPPYTTLSLNGSLGGIPGTFVPWGDPVFNESTVYVITQFKTSNQTQPSGSFRLYAVNLTQNAVSWFVDLPAPSAAVKAQAHDVNTRREDVSTKADDAGTETDEVTGARAMVHKGVVYVNYGRQGNCSLCAVKDQHTTSTTLWCTTHKYLGPMAMYDVTVTWTNMSVTGVRPVWVMNRDPPLVTGYHPDTGHVLSNGIDIARLAPKAVGMVTSDLMVARQPNNTDTDVLMFATQTLLGHAYVTAIEAGLHPAKPRLLWSRDVSDHKGQPWSPDILWTVRGQIANVAVADDGGWTFGVALTVQEHKSGGSTTSVKVLI